MKLLDGLVLSCIFASMPTLASPCTRILNWLKAPGPSVVAKAFDKTNFYWQFPSDHLPAIAKLRLLGSRQIFSVMTWNVLNQNYLGHITDEKNAQGLKISEITDTLDRHGRILHILSETAEGIQPSLIALQEVDEILFERLKPWAVANNYEMAFVENPSAGSLGRTIDYGVTLINSSFFVKSDRPNSVLSFSPSRKPRKYIHTVTLQTHDGLDFDFVNVHRDFEDQTEFSRFLSRSPSFPTLVVGDLNLEPDAVEKLLVGTSYRRMLKLPNEFTHIDTRRNLVDYDQMLIAGFAQLENAPRLTRRARFDFQLSRR